MTHSSDTLEALFDKVRALPLEARSRAVDALEELTRDEPYRLSREEMAILEPELERARNGVFASVRDVAEILQKPWRKPASGK